MTTSQVPAQGAAKPLSPALDKTFKIGLVLKGLAEVAGGVDASGAGEQPVQQQAGQVHGPPDQAGSAEHPAGKAVRDIRS
jgi:hypothetical protein